MSRALQRILLIVGLIVVAILLLPLFYPPTTRAPGVSSAATINLAHLVTRMHTKDQH